jgi:hypothetical protein
MAERAASPRLIKFVRRALRAEPRPEFEEVLGRWRAQPRSTEDAELVRTVYTEELAVLSAPAEPPQTRVVLITVAVWIVAHIGLALGIGLPAYVSCRATGATGTFLGCGASLGLTFVGVGSVQLVYGLIAAVIAVRFRRAVAQGILIGMGTVLVLFTIVCFGAGVTS